MADGHQCILMFKITFILLFPTYMKSDPEYLPLEAALFIKEME